MTTDDDKELITYDQTKLSAFNTCPTWGIIRYAHHKRFATIGRAMALEAGSAMHEVFAFVRLITLARQLDALGRSPDFINTLLDANGHRLFGEDRWAAIIDNSPVNESVDDRLKHDVISVLETGDFYDDDRDKRRTLTNLEECALAYINRWDFKPLVWMRDYEDAHSDVGIEIPYDVTVIINDVPSFRFTGKLDGLRWHGQGDRRRLVVEDNKTGSRLNDAWEMSFETSHQLTGYCLASSVFTGATVSDAEAIGLAIPIPRMDYNGYLRAQVSRSPEQMKRFVSWMLYTVEGFKQLSAQPLDAPMFTHSCNRYFRPCSFIPFCASDRDDREQMFSEMIVDEWSPLHTVTTLEGE
jgi:hypothetical protein